MPKLNQTQHLLDDLKSLRASLILEARSFDLLGAICEHGTQQPLHSSISAAYRVAAYELAKIITKYEAK
jgi:hypothetical protein